MRPPRASGSETLAKSAVDRPAMVWEFQPTSISGSSGLVPSRCRFRQNWDEEARMKPKIQKFAVWVNFACLTVCVAMPHMAVAQAVNVSIQGRIYDSTGAAISQAEV